VDLTDAIEASPTGSRRRVDQVAGGLVGGRCLQCSATAWPRRSVCHRCGSTEVAETTFAPVGALLTYTTIHVPRPGLATPYTLGQIALSDGPLVFAQVRGLSGDPALPLPVRLTLSPEGAGPGPWYWFEPAGQGQADVAGDP
jgi:uncharacterized OB-fold protein